MAEYIDAAETAKLIRKALALKFPGMKFSVKTSRYSGGASIDVYWTDGPSGKMVDAVVKPFEGRGFDGMVDLAYSIESYLLPDGTAAFAATSGTEGSAGVVPKAKQWMPVAGAKRVRFGANYVFTKRSLSVPFLQRAVDTFKKKWGAQADGMGVKPGFDGAYVEGVPEELRYFWLDAIGKRVGVMPARKSA